MIFAVLLTLSTCLAGFANAGYSNGQPAAIAIGQQNLSYSGINATPGVGAVGFSVPGGTWSDGNILIVADTNNNRVLIYNSVPMANGVSADVVVGQPDFVSSVANQGGSPAANTLSFPTGVYFDGSSLYVADTGNNRVLIYYGLPNLNNTAADVVVGQAFFSSGMANQGGSVGANTLNAPQGVYSDGVSLSIADTGNNRVLVYNSIPSSLNGSADLVLGQPNMTVRLSNQGTTTKAYTLSAPTGLRAAGGNLYVSDRGNNRVLIYKPIPIVNGSSATIVVGQTMMSSGTFMTVSSMTLSGPTGIDTDGTHLFISDNGNSRVLIYNTIPTGNGVGANLVIGQSNMSSGFANRRGSVAANTLSGPGGLIFDGTQLYVSDRGNNRVLLYNPLPSSNGTNASVVAGQSNMTTASANQASNPPASNSLFHPGGVWTDRTKLYVADRFNNRVLIYNSAPTSTNASADIVVGQAFMSSGSVNMGGQPGAATLAAPFGVFSDGNKLFVADTSNNRVLFYNTVPSTNGVAASVVLGQPAFNSNTANSGGVSASSLNFPTGVTFDGTRLYVADRSNNRVLVYNSVPGVSNAPANFVLGQSLMTTSVANQGGLGAKSLSLPTGIYSDGSKLFVADQFNNRILIYTLPISANGVSASVVVGQPNMTSNSPNQGLSAATNATLRFPNAVYSDGSSLYVSDSGNNRILVYTPVPSANGAAASSVIGQSSFTSLSVNQGMSVGPTTLAAPSGVCVDSTTGRMYVGDTNSNRALLFLPSVASPVGGSGATVTLASPVSPLIVQVQVPSGAVPAGVNMIVSIQTGLPGPASPAQTARGTGIGFEITLDQALSPTVPLTVTASYRPADLAGFDISKLILARYDDAASAWVPLPSVSDVANNRIVAQTNHFSIFQIMQVDPASNDLSTVRVFPNPFQPPAGQTAMTFASLPSNARVRIYTVTGLLIKDLSADVNGIARWDGTNQSGVSVASGIYFAYVQGSGRSRMFTVSVQR